MNKYILAAAVITLSLSACKDTQEQKQTACLSMLSAYCQKVEECTEQLTAECLEFASYEDVCKKEIKSSVKDIRACEQDLGTTTCDSPPVSCMTLE